MNESNNQPLITLSDLHQYDNFELLARQVVEGSIIGLHKSPFHGFSVEFAEHRLYNQGDPMKSIDWKVYGRTGKYFVKKFEEETNLRCQIVIDASSSMFFPEKESMSEGIRFNKLAFSIVSAGALMHILKRQRDAIGLSIFTDKVEEHTKTRSTTVHHRLINSTLEKYLKSPQRGVKTSAAQCLHEIAENTHRRSMVVIFSDLFDNTASEDEVFNALQHLKYAKHEVVLFHVVDQKREIEFNWPNRPIRFIDQETNEEVKVASPMNIQKSFHEQIKAKKERIKMKCAQFRIDFVEADINKDFNQVLIPYFNKRAKMMV